MPQRIERSLVFEDLENHLAARIISTSTQMIASFTDSDGESNDSSTSSGIDDFLMDTELTIYTSILSHRYFSERHPNKVNSSCMADDVLRMNPTRFKARFRMLPLSFEKIWKMIENHDIFKNNSTTQQFDPRLHF